MLPAAATCCPIVQRVTPAPSASTVPAQSTPGMSGSTGARRVSLPARRLTSRTRLTVAAWTLIRISPCRGCGSGTSSYLRTSGGPNSRITIAFMRLLVLAWDGGPGCRRCAISTLALRQAKGSDAAQFAWLCCSPSRSLPKVRPEKRREASPGKRTNDHLDVQGVGADFRSVPERPVGHHRQAGGAYRRQEVRRQLLFQPAVLRRYVPLRASSAAGLDARGALL